MPARHRAHFVNGPTEALNNLIKRAKRAAFAFTSFQNYRIRSLLYAGKPNWERVPHLRVPAGSWPADIAMLRASTGFWPQRARLGRVRGQLVGPLGQVSRVFIRHAPMAVQNTIQPTITSDDTNVDSGTSGFTAGPPPPPPPLNGVGRPPGSR